MNKKVIALRGVADVGKSDTIRKVYELLLRKYPNYEKEHDKQLTDISVVLIINGIKIGIEGQGDPSRRLEESLSLFVKVGCGVIICATRTRGQTVEAVEKLEPDYEVVWFEQVVKSTASEQQASNLAMAEKIVKEVENIIRA